MSNFPGRVLTCVFCFWFVSTSTLGTIANAQSTARDFEAPIIEHEENVSGIFGDVESFVATVGDNEGLKSVNLFYRYAGESEFTEITMEPLVQSSYYSASVNTGTRSGNETAIEYYIRAEDTAENVVFKGLPFNPLIRSLVDINNTVNSAAADPVEQKSPTKSTSDRKVNWVYVALGALIVGGIAAAAGGGDDGKGNTVANDVTDPGCTVNCNVTLTLTTP